MQKGFIFDMDGTMFDTEGISLDAYDTVGEMFGIRLSETEKLGFLGLPSEKIAQRFYTLFGEDFDWQAFRKKKMEVQNAVIAEIGVPIKAGLFEMLQYAKENHILCAVATSTSAERAMPLLAGAGVLDAFGAVICGDQITRGKPNPDIFLRAAEELGLSPEECVVFEDSRNGILAAKAAGMFSILIPDKIAPDAEMWQAADLLCKDLIEAKAYFEK